MKAILKKSGEDKKFTLSVGGKLWIECDDHPVFGPGPAELLEKIRDSGSINKAARQMGMSYKKAWEIIGALNAASEQPMVVTQSGGESGGGSTISVDAEKLIRYYHRLRQRYKNFLLKESEKISKHFR